MRLDTKEKEQLNITSRNISWCHHLQFREYSQQRLEADVRLRSQDQGLSQQQVWVKHVVAPSI